MQHYAPAGVTENVGYRDILHPASSRWSEQFAVSIIGQHLSLRRKFRALNHSTISPLPQKGVQSPRAFILLNSGWMNPMYAYGYSHTHIGIWIMHINPTTGHFSVRRTIISRIEMKTFADSILGHYVF